MSLQDFAPDAAVEVAFRPPEAPRRILVYAPLAYWTPHFETDLEIAQRHLDLGDEVELVVCDGELRFCQCNPSHDSKYCLQCISRSIQGAEQLTKKPRTLALLSFLTPEDHAKIAQLPAQFASTAQLKRYCFESFDAGMATVSSIIDFLRNPVCDTTVYAADIRRSLVSAVSSYLAFLRILSAQSYDRVYIFNGRWSMVRSVVRACEQKKIEYYTHERAADVRKFSLYQNCLPHDMAYYRKQVRLAWERNHLHPDFNRVGASFFEDRRARVERTWFSFVKTQEAGCLPSDWNRESRRMLFCTSSEFEFAAIDEGTLGRVYPSQLVAASRIARLLAKADPNIHLWIRIHPNDNTPETARDWTNLAQKLPNVTVVLPDSKVDSYAMIEGAERVLTFGSTIGLEASYWGKPSICAEHSFYGDMDAQYEAHSEEELMALLLQPELQAKPRDNAIAVGFYLNTFGERFKHFETDTISDLEYKSTFRGKPLKPDIAEAYRQMIALLDCREFRRAAVISRQAIQFAPQNGVAHSVHILSLLRMQAHEHALTALEGAHMALSADQRDQLLGNIAQDLLNLAMQLSKTNPAYDFNHKVRRIAQVLASAPRFAPISQRLLQMVNRPHGTATPPHTPGAVGIHQN